MTRNDGAATCGLGAVGAVLGPWIDEPVFRRCRGRTRLVVVAYDVVLLVGIRFIGTLTAI